MSDATVRLNSEHPNALPAGTRLDEYEVLSVLGVGGFGIVYLVFDHALDREVAVKEYMPASLAGRTETMHVSVRSRSDADTFELGLNSFRKEAKLLASFDHPALLKVYRSWDANGTAYMSMPVMHGRTLKEVRAEMAQPPDEVWLRALLRPLLDVLASLHGLGVLHRDIAPDNIKIEPDGRPVLLDFGAARRVISGKTQTLTAILKPAYAPIEQYADDDRVKQGPWTDLYALGATLHYLLLHRPPPPATTRAVHDDASALSPAHCPGCSEGFLKAIDWMLAPRPADRPQSVAALREVLDGQVTQPVGRTAAPETDPWERTVVLDRPSTPRPAAAAATAVPDLPLDDDATRVIPPPAAARPDDAVAPPEARRAAASAAVSATPGPAASAAAASSSAAAPVADDFAVPPVSVMQGQAATAASRAPWWPWAAGAALVAVAAGSYLFWPGGVLPEGPAGAAASASAPVQAAAPEPAASLPPLPAVPESTVTTVVLPSTRAAPAGATAERAPATAPGPAANDGPAGAGAPPPRGPAPARNTRPAPVEPAPSPTAITAAPLPAKPAGPAPAAAAAVPPAASAPLPAPGAKPAAAAGPEAVCEGRNPILHFVCMERECLRSTNMEHADCVKWRAEARREPRN